MQGGGIKNELPAHEELLGGKFSVALAYVHFDSSLSSLGLDPKFLEECGARGIVPEITMQTTTSNNLNLFGRSPLLDIYKGLKDDEIRELAKTISEYGKPVMFRLNNEMNSDWTSWSGVVNLCDPDIYVAVWHRFYDIFSETGADNVIWIFNPNDRSYPPCSWNTPLAYYPGNEYVQMFGVTGYNTGTYYKDVNGESWRSFKTIYDSIYREYGPFFDKFPWIITEFASSSIGGDKAEWIDGMFKNIGRYENIKVAVWFDADDIDESSGTAARTYRIADSPEVIDAWQRGFEKHPPKCWQSIFP